MAIVKKGFIVEGTTCDACEKIIKRQTLKVHGVKEVTFDLQTETGFVTFNDSKTDLDEILSKIEENPQYVGYILKEGHASKKSGNSLGWIIAAIGILVAAYVLFGFVDGIQLPEISQNMGYGLLFIVGLLTGFHCVGMCGPFVVGYTAKDAQEGRKSHVSHMLYGSGKLLSYTIIGAIFGLIGSIIAFTPMLRGIIGLLAGIFLIFFGLKMLNIIPALRKVHFGMPKFLGRFIGYESKNAGPLTIGLLNGLMIACGPLLAVYIMAAGTGSMIEGAKLLFIFGLGTLPVMLGFGYFLSFLSGKATQKILKLSGAIVIVLGIIMMNTGLALSGTGYDFKSITARVSTLNAGLASPSDAGGLSPVVLKDGYQEIRMDVTRYGWEPDTFVLKKGVPVKWIINGKQITSCNNAIQVPKYKLKFDIKPGEQTIEFTPTEEGIVPWSCWMGMIPGTFIVKDNIDLNDAAAVQKEIASAPAPKATGGCGCGGGGVAGTCGV